MWNRDNLVVYESVPQRSELWFQLRAGHLTASNFDRLVTPKTGRRSAQQEDLILELCASCLRPDEVTFEGNMHTDRGEALEPEARDLFRKMTGLDVMEVGFVRRQDAPIGCSPDGLIGTCLDDVEAGLEIKCPLSKNHVRYIVDGGLPAKYRPQVHGSMAVTGLRAWWFLSYCPGLKPHLVRVEWNEYTDIIKDALDVFRTRYLERYLEVMPLIRPEEGGEQ